MTQLRLSVGFAGLVAALAVAYAATHQQWIWPAIGLAGAVAVAVGVARHRPRRRAPWYLVMAALLALTAGHAADLALGDRAPDLPGSVAGLTYLVVFVPLLVAAVAKLARSDAAVLDRIHRLDALIITAGVALLTWTLVIGPTLDHPTEVLLATVIEVAYPATGLLLVALLVELAATARWTPALAASVGGTLGMLGVSLVVGIARLHGQWLTDGPVMLGWALLATGWGAAALHPTMAVLGKLPAAQLRFPTRRRLVVVALGALLVPLHLVVDASLRDHAELAVRRGLMAMIIGLVLLRMYHAVSSQRRGLERERTLRTAGAQLTAATTAAEVTSVVRSAVTRLLPADTPHEVVLEVHGPATTVAGAAPGSSRPTTGSATTDADPAGHAGHADHGTAGSLHRGVVVEGGDRRGVPDTVHRCPLVLPGRDGDDPDEVGVLYVTAPGRVLAHLRATLEVLAAQAALALDRIRLTAEINRNASERYFRTLVQSATDMILIADPDGTVRYASPSATAVLEGGTPAKLCDLVAVEDHPALKRVMRKLTEGTSGGGSAVTECTVVTTDLRRIRVEVTLRDLRADPTVDGVIVTLRDVTEQRRLQRELTFLAFHDALTGLANRALFYERLDRALAHPAWRPGEVAVLFLDLDDLKETNDTFGHAAGDDLLVAAARRLSAAVGTQDTVARLGGDEFAVLLEDLADPAQVDAIARRVVAAFEPPFPLAGRPVRVGVSIGAAVADGRMDGDELLRCADEALYEAKNAGKACWRRFGRARDPHPQLGHAATPPDVDPPPGWAAPRRRGWSPAPSQGTAEASTGPVDQVTLSGPRPGGNARD